MKVSFLNNNNTGFFSVIGYYVDYLEFLKAEVFSKRSITKLGLLILNFTNTNGHLKLCVCVWILNFK